MSEKIADDTQCPDEEPNPSASLRDTESEMSEKIADNIQCPDEEGMSEKIADNIQCPDEERMSEKIADDIQCPDEEPNQSASLRDTESGNESSSNEEMKSAEEGIAVDQESTIRPKFSLQSYPELPMVILDASLEEQLNNYGKLGDVIEKRLLIEIEEGRKKLEELGMTEDSFKAQYGEEFNLYQYATETYPCIVPGTQLTAFYLEFIRLFILLLARELKHRHTKTKDGDDPSSAPTTQLVESATEACGKVSINVSNPPQTKSENLESSKSGDEKTEDVAETAKSSLASNILSEHSYSNSPVVSSSFSLHIGEGNDEFISKLTVLKNMLDSDPVTKAFATKLELLIDNLKSVYYTGEETTEDSSTSADVSDLPVDPILASHPDVVEEGEASGIQLESLPDEKEPKDGEPCAKLSTVPAQTSTDSSCDIDNLPEDIREDSSVSR